MKGKKQHVGPRLRALLEDGTVYVLEGSYCAIASA